MITRKIKAEGQEIATFFEITGAICSNSERSDQIWFLEVSYLRSNRLEQLKFQWEKIIGIQKHAGKVRKIHNFVNGARQGSVQGRYAKWS